VLHHYYRRVTSVRSCAVLLQWVFCLTTNGKQLAPAEISIATCDCKFVSELFIKPQYRVSHLTWNSPRQHAAAAASELPGNESVTAHNIAVAC
jgi:hypothetical protein